MSRSIGILLATYQGERFLREQLASIATQQHADWQLIAADDGSTDATPTILSEFAATQGSGRVLLCRGPGHGATANFLALATAAPPDHAAYAFCDQDDIWENDKIARAFAWLASVPAEVPALYCSRARLIDAYGHSLGFSPLSSKAPGFAHALVQNIASGNTMVFNAAARQLLVYAGSDIAVPVHDWWLYLAVTACGGTVHYDPIPTVRYRQHAHNAIGSGAGMRARLRRFRAFLRGRHAAWSAANVAALERLLPFMPEKQRQQLAAFNTARTAARPWQRLAALRRSGVYRQGVWGNGSLWLGALIDRL